MALYCLGILKGTCLSCIFLAPPLWGGHRQWGLNVQYTNCCLVAITSIFPILPYSISLGQLGLPTSRVRPWVLPKLSLLGNLL